MTRFLCGGLGLLLIFAWDGTSLSGQPRKAPPGMFKDLDDKSAGDARIVHGRQLFIDDYVIGELNGVRKKLNQPVKYVRNPLIVCDKPWEGRLGYSSVMHDADDGFYKMWYGAWSADGKQQALCYATSPDGLAWRKPVTVPWAAKDKTNIVFGLTPEFNCAGVFKDPEDPDDKRRYKMLYSDYPGKTAQTASTSAAFSPDGIHWVASPQNPVIPFSDSHNCPFRDPRRARYVAYLRYGPPNSRLISRIESEDFVRWSPKVTVLRRTALDEPFNTVLYQMEVMPYEGVYLGLISTYHGETIQPIPKGKEAWMDKLDVQLAFSRNGVTWQRVVEPSLLRDAEAGTLKPTPETWQRYAVQATFIPFGRHGKDWDWGGIYPLQAPVVAGDEIHIYYAGYTGRHWGRYHGDKNIGSIGLATLRRDGFVSVDGGEFEGSLTTRPLIFIGDSLEINADARGGSIAVETLDEAGKPILGFTKADCARLNTDQIRHLVQWKGSDNCQLLQARPIRLKFYLTRSKLYSFTPRILHKNYIPSYD